MRNRSLAISGLIAIISLLLPSVAAGQTARNRAKPYNPPRMPDGYPNLQGTYDLAMLTPLERPQGVPAVLTKDAAAKLETAAAQRRAQGDAPVRGDRAAPAKGGDVGNYNYGWFDSGSSYTVVNGEKRSSLIVDPPDGRIPSLASQARSGSTQENAPGAYDDPERLSPGDRCIVGFGSTVGPPILPAAYNNLHQIVQTSDGVMILSEMVHDARIVRMNAQHLPAKIRLWKGDSVGHWEGDTLVVDTTNFTEKTRFRGSTPDLHVVERFTRVDERTLLYRFTIDDPATWTKPWTGEYTWPATDAHIYEYACHEGNYALTDILKGARLRDKEAAARLTK